MLLGWKAPGASEPGAREQEPVEPLVLSAGAPLPADWESREEYLVEGAHCAVEDADYRSLIHRRVHRSYNFGARNNKSFDYDKFFAATDTLLDVGNILHVALIARWPKDENIGQLWMYGVLQALVVEQDAASQLMKCFDIKPDPAIQSELNKIKELRVATAGHPSSHTRTDVKGCTYLGHRDFRQRSKFHIVTLSGFERAVHRLIDLPELIATQRRALNVHLRRVWLAAKDDPAFDMEPT